MKAIECNDVWMVYKRFMQKGFIALKGVTLDIEFGELFGLLGPNGAGKTTLISILSTILIPTKGDVKIIGMDAFKNLRKVREKINISSGSRLPWGMKVYECLRFYALCYGVTNRQVVERLLTEFDLEKFRNMRFDELSSGNKQKLNLARAFINNPEIVFFDEPTANLDPDVARKIREIIRRVVDEKGTTVVLTTHNMREAEIMCDRIAFINDGKIVAVGKSEELKRIIKTSERVIVKFKEPISKLKTSIPHELKGNSAIFFVNNAEKDVVKLILELEKIGIEIESVKVEEVTLEDVFVNFQKSIGEVLAFTYRNYVLTKNEFYAIFEMLFWPVISMISVGLLGEFLYLNKNEVAFILIGVIALSIIQIVQIDVTYVLLLDMWSMSLEYIIATPTPFYKMVIGAWLFGIVRGSVAFILLIILSSLLFNFYLETPLLVLILFILGLFASAMLIGIFNCILILVFGRRAEIFAWTLTAIVMIFCGIYYPVTILPEPFRTLGLAIPITHFLEYFRMSYGFSPTMQDPLLIGVIETVIYSTIFLILVEASMRRARKTGLVLKLSG